MAIVVSNDLTSGLRGKLGQFLVFRNVHGKTVVSRAPKSPDKSKETVAQRQTRANFKETSQWAKVQLQDPEQKAYFLRRARKLNLTNARIAAISDFMRGLVQKNPPMRTEIAITTLTPFSSSL